MNIALPQLTTSTTPKPTLPTFGRNPQVPSQPVLQVPASKAAIVTPAAPFTPPAPASKPTLPTLSAPVYTPKAVAVPPVALPTPPAPVAKPSMASRVALPKVQPTAVPNKGIAQQPAAPAAATVTAGTPPASAPASDTSYQIRASAPVPPSAPAVPAQETRPAAATIEAPPTSQPWVVYKFFHRAHYFAILPDKYRGRGIVVIVGCLPEAGSECDPVAEARLVLNGPCKVHDGLSGGDDSSVATAAGNSYEWVNAEWANSSDTQAETKTTPVKAA